jgi:isochorismate hydrolase
MCSKNDNSSERNVSAEQSVSPFYDKREFCLNPEKCALLVIDMQEFFRGIAEPVIDNVKKVITECRNRDMRIIYTRHGHRDITLDGGMLAVWWSRYARYGSPEWELLSELSPRENDVIIDKNRYSAFYNTDLDIILKGAGIEQIIITGVMTNCCCETTARDAFMRDYRVFFISDATSTANKDLHASSLKNLAYGFAHVVGTEKILKTLE